MTGWAKDQGTTGSMIQLLGDPRSEFTEALGVKLDHPGPMAVLGNPRCKRFSMLLDNCVVKTLNVAEGEDDPAGDAKPEVSMVDKMLEDLEKLKAPAGETTAVPEAASETTAVPEAAGETTAVPAALAFEYIPEVSNIPAVALSGFLAGCGITIGVVRLRRGVFAATEGPLVVA